MATNLDLINAALTRTGSNPITALNSVSAEAAVASANYEEIVKDIIASYPWKFATKIEQLSLLNEGEVPEPWSYAYQKPVDLLDIRTVKVSGLPIAYELHGNAILCDADSTQEVIAHYMWRAPESTMPPWVRNAIIVRLEALFLRSIGERYQEAEARDGAAGEALARAKLRDAQGQTARQVMTSPTLRARSGCVERDAIAWRR